MTIVAPLGAIVIAFAVFAVLGMVESEVDPLVLDLPGAAFLIASITPSADLVLFLALALGLDLGARVAEI